MTPTSTSPIHAVDLMRRIRDALSAEFRGLSLVEQKQMMARRIAAAEREDEAAESPDATEDRA